LGALLARYWLMGVRDVVETWHMDDSFLEEQLERMRRLTERMSQVHSHVAEYSELISRDRDALHSGPLQRVRDLRTYQTYDYEIHRPHTRSAERPRMLARDASRRRRRR
jgi:hypothetical protein